MIAGVTGRSPRPTRDKWLSEIATLPLLRRATARNPIPARSRSTAPPTPLTVHPPARTRRPPPVRAGHGYAATAVRSSPSRAGKRGSTNRQRGIVIFLGAAGQLRQPAHGRPPYRKPTDPDSVPGGCQDTGTGVVPGDRSATSLTINPLGHWFKCGDLAHSGTHREEHHVRERRLAAYSGPEGSPDHATRPATSGWSWRGSSRMPRRTARTWWTRGGAGGLGGRSTWPCLTLDSQPDAGSSP